MTARFNDHTKLDEHVRDTLKLSGSKERFSGVVVGYDQVGTTIFISSGERTLLAFTDQKLPLQPGDQVTFRIDGVRAIDVQKIPAETPR